MRGDVEHYCSSIPRWHETQNGEQAACNDHQCWRFDAHGDNVGVRRSMFHSKGISDVSSMVNESENDQRCEYDIYKSGEWTEYWVGERELVAECQLVDQRRDTAY